MLHFGQSEYLEYGGYVVADPARRPFFRDPPVRISYVWHLFFDRSEATEMTVTFTEVESGARVRLIQSGFEKLGDDAGTQRRRAPTMPGRS